MKNPQLWLITDTHFNWNYERFGKLRPQGFEELFLKNCRKLIAPQDVVIHLGDVINDRQGELEKKLVQIPGRTKILIRGNHDNKSDVWYLNKGFDLVCDHIVKENCVLSHRPVPIPDGLDFNIHGHFHDNTLEHCFNCEPELKAFYSDRHKRYALEYTDYCPVLFDEWKK
jgi:calcineurin-like phosphoesterase family protein